MHTIGSFSSQSSSPSPYIEELKSKNLLITFLDEEHDLDKAGDFDLLILDYSTVKAKHMEDICELLLRLAQFPTPYIWILVCESSKLDRLIYLQLGATGTIDQRIEPDEFSIYLTNFLDKSIPNELPAPNESAIEENDHLTFLPKKLSIILEGNKEILLTKLEYKLMNFLAKKKGDTATYDEIYQLLWPNQLKVDQHQIRIANTVFRLRKKIEPDLSHPKYIKTVRTIGYSFPTI